LLNCAVPSSAESSQYFAEASQNFTCPGFTGVEPETTVAVSVTTVPAATEVTSLPPAFVTVSVVVVAAAVAHAWEVLNSAEIASVAGRTKARIVAGRTTNECPGPDTACIAEIIWTPELKKRPKIKCWSEDGIEREWNPKSNPGHAGNFYNSRADDTLVAERMRLQPYRYVNQASRTITTANKSFLYLAMPWPSVRKNWFLRRLHHRVKVQSHLTMWRLPWASGMPRDRETHSLGDVAQERLDMIQLPRRQTRNYAVVIAISPSR
jgi:hypothetical protein